MRVRLGAPAVAVLLGVTTVSAPVAAQATPPTPPCCDNTQVGYPPDGAQGVPLNARFAVKNFGSAALERVSDGTAVAVTREPFPGAPAGWDYVVPAATLEPDTAYRLYEPLLPDQDVRFTTGTATDQSPPTVELDPVTDGSLNCGCGPLLLRLGFDLVSYTDDAALAEGPLLSVELDDGSTVRRFMLSGDLRSTDAFMPPPCIDSSRLTADGTYDVTVTAYDAAGHASAPLTFGSVTPAGACPRPDGGGGGGGCSVGGAESGHGPPALLALLGAVLAAWAGRRRRPGRNRSSGRAA